MVKAALCDCEHNVLVHSQTGNLQVKNGLGVWKLNHTSEWLSYLESSAWRVFEGSVVNLAILGSQENLEEILLTCIVIDVNRAEGPWPSGLLLPHGVDLVDMVVLPVAVEQFVLSQKDTMHSLTIHKHLFDVLSLNDIFVDQRRLGALQLVQICPSNYFISAGEGP